MTRTPLLLAIVAAAALAGCDNQGQTIVAGGPAEDPATQAPATNGPIELPPAIAASKKYRCKDNGIVQIDWLADNKSANLRAEGEEPVVRLTAPEPGQPLTAEGGYSLSGSAEAGSVSLTRPGKGTSSCKA